MCREILQKTREYTVKIQVNNEVGTGVVFAPKLDDHLYIFTTLHSIENFFDMEVADIIVKFYFFDKNGHMRVNEYRKEEIEFISFANDWETYESCKETARDIAVLKIPRNTFNEEGKETIAFPKLKIVPRGFSENGIRLYGAGYPNDSKAPEDLTAIENAMFEENGRYHIKCTLKNISRFEEMMKGYSGGGLFAELRDKSLRLVCLTSGCEEGEQNNHFYAVPVHEIMDKMKAEGWPDPRSEDESLPESLDGFIDLAADFFADEFQECEYEAVKMGLEDLQTLGLRPNSFWCEGINDKFASIRCCDDSSNCENYWKGQLIKAYCFCKVNGEALNNLNDLKYLLQSKNNSEEINDVKIEFLCSNQNPADFIRNLLEQKFYVDNSKIKDGSIFIWNGQGMKTAYPKIYNRASINRICRNVLTMHDSTKVNSAGRKKLEGTEYNIVNGDVPYFNYAIIGTQKLALSVIEKSKGDESKMRKNLCEIMREAWEKDDE